MNNDELKAARRLLDKAIKQRDWDYVYEVIDFLSDYIESDEEDEENYDI